MLVLQRWAVIAVLAVLAVTVGGCGSGSKMNVADLDSKATHVVDAEMRGDYAAASADFTAGAARKYPPACLAQIHDNLVRDYGAVQHEDAPVQTTPGGRSISVIVHFDRGQAVSGEVTFDGAERIKTLFFARPTKPAGGPPSACPSK